MHLVVQEINLDGDNMEEESNKYLEDELEDDYIQDPEAYMNDMSNWKPEELENARTILWNTFGEKLLQIATAVAAEANLGNIFELFSTNLNTVHNWNEHIVYNCPLKTMFLKDSRDINSGIGFIFNMITPDTLFIGTIGTAYLNTKTGFGIHNTYWEVKTEYLDDEQLWDALKSKLEDYVMAKYNIVIPKRD